MARHRWFSRLEVPLLLALALPLLSKCAAFVPQSQRKHVSSSWQRFSTQKREESKSRNDILAAHEQEEEEEEESQRGNDIVEAEKEESSKQLQKNELFVKEDSRNDLFATPLLNNNGTSKRSSRRLRRKMALMWCGKDFCKDNIRERMVDEHVLLNGPATGQVAYYWDPSDAGESEPSSLTRYVLLFVRPGDEKLLRVAANAIKEWTSPSMKNKTGFQDEIKIMYVCV